MEDQRDIYWQDIEKSFEGDLEGKTAIVTGGSKGIGRAITEMLLDNGAEVVIVSRSSGEQVAGELGENCEFMAGNVRDSGRVQEIVDKVVEEYGKLDVLVNNAGFADLNPIKEESEEDFQKIWETNFKGVRNFTSASASHIEESGGSIINIASIWGIEDVNFPGDSTYSAAKAATIKYTEIANEELEARVNCISPALVETEIIEDIPQEAIDDFVGHYTTRDELLQPEDIARVAEFVLKNGNVSGKNLIRDAGYTR